MKNTVFTLALIFFSVNIADAEVFKWKDADGKTHYSDTPPSAGSSLKAEVVKTEKNPPPVPANKITPVTIKEPAVIDSPDKALLKNQGACHMAKNRKSLLLSGKLIVVTNKGQTGFMMDEQRQAALAEVEKIIEQHC